MTLIETERGIDREGVERREEGQWETGGGGRQTLRAFGLALFDIEKIVFYCYFISNAYRSGGIFTLTSASRMPPTPRHCSPLHRSVLGYNNFMLSPATLFVLLRLP